MKHCKKWDQNWCIFFNPQYEMGLEPETKMTSLIHRWPQTSGLSWLRHGLCGKIRFYHPVFMVNLWQLTKPCHM